MKRILLGFCLLLSLSLSAQSWQSKPVVRIEDIGQSFLYTFSDSSNAYINKCNVSYIVNMPNSQWVQVGYMYDGSTSRIITASYSSITQPDLSSAKVLSDTLNAWLRDCAGSGGGGGGDSGTTDTFFYSVRYGQIDTLMDNNQLNIGATYKINDRGDLGLFFKALSDSTISESGQRVMLCPKYYGVGTFEGNDWIGVWNAGKSVVAGDLAIWGGLVWENETGNIGTADDDFNLDGTNWTVVAKVVGTIYTPINFDVRYNFANDWITEQTDKYNNTVGYGLDILGYQPCDVTDWNSTLNGGVAIYANTKAVLGIFNNSMLSPKVISGNVSSKIANNTDNVENINGNMVAVIYNNNNVGEISFNQSPAFIQNLSSDITNVNFNLSTGGGLDGTSTPFDTLHGAIENYQFGYSIFTVDNSVNRLVGVDDIGRTFMVDKSSISGGSLDSTLTGVVITIDTLTFQDINSAPTDPVLEFNHVLVPEGWYVERLFAKTIQPFDAPTEFISNVDIYWKTIGEFGIPCDLATSAPRTNVNTYDALQFSTGTEPFIIQVTITGNNPQDFTEGSMIFKALIKKSPF